MTFVGNLKSEIRRCAVEYLHGVRRRCAERKLNRDLAEFKKVGIFEGEDLSQHFGDEYVPDTGLQHVIKSFMIDRINFVDEVIGSKISTSSFVDVGDSDGIFIKAFGKNRLSVNMSVEALRNIGNKGLEGVRAHIEKLPFKNGGFDHVLCFQTLEHVPNPIVALKELGRICRESAIVSIPYVSNTNIYRYNYDPSRPIFQHHIFEFSDADFRKVVSHSGLKVRAARTVDVFDCDKNLIDLLAFRIWNVFRGKDVFCGCFTKFTIYHLVKGEGNEFTQ